MRILEVDCELVKIPADTPTHQHHHVDHIQSHFNPLYALSASHLLRVYKPECIDLLQLTIVNNNKVADELAVTHDMVFFNLSGDI